MGQGKGGSHVSSNTHHLEYLKNLLASEFDIPAEDVTPEARLYEDLGIDSIDAVDMIVQLRRVTGERISPQQFKAVRTVQDVVDIMNRMAA